MRVALFGATGMIGSGVLIEALRDSNVESVVSVGRNRLSMTHDKLHELLRTDFTDYSDIRTDLTGLDACFFCLGVSAAGMSESEYSRVTYDITLAAAEALIGANPHITFCYVSGHGTDSTGQGRFMWARVKGRTENALLALTDRSFMFRPGFIRPIRGVRSKTALYRAFYAVVGPLYPLLRRAFPDHVTTSEDLGRAMLRVAREGYTRRILETADINVLAAA